MGKICKILCKCGYTKKLYVGGGLAACNINMVNMVFSEEKLKQFNSYYKNNEVKGFFVENELALCGKCKEIITVAVLRAELTDNRKLKIVNDCPKCNEKVKVLSELGVCPKCGEKMMEQDVGDWD